MLLMRMHWVCRARIEDDYAKNIEKLNKTVEFSAEIGFVSYYANLSHFVKNLCALCLIIPLCDKDKGKGLGATQKLKCFTAKVSEQVNRKCCQTNEILQLLTS